MFNQKITFAITTYINNSEREKYLYECIDSIINQTNPNWEILISNDNSPIELDFLKYKNENRIEIFKQEKNIWMFNWWNFLLEKCNTDWFIPMWDDDIVENNMVEKIINIFKSNNDIEVISFSWNIVDKNLNNIQNIINNENWIVKWWINFFNENINDLRKWKLINILFFCSLFKTELLKNIWWFKNYWNPSDMYISPKVSLFAKNIFFTKDILIKIRKHNNNASNKTIYKNYKDFWKISLILLKEFEKELNIKNKKYLKKISNYNFYFFKEIILINFVKKIWLYSFLSPLWRKYILKQK